jgi:hypothetical protein
MTGLMNAACGEVRRDAASSRGSMSGSGSKAVNLNTSICLPLFIQQRTFLRTAALRRYCCKSLFGMTIEISWGR